MLRWLWVSFAIIGLDLLTKQWAVSNLAVYQSLPLFPYFDLTLMFNPGAAFSFLSDQGGWQRWFFIVVSALVTTGLVVWLLKLDTDERLTAIALSLIIGGAMGNLIDRVYYGYVIDFIDLYYVADGCLPFFGSRVTADISQCHWPAFNIADSAISTGVVLMLFDAFVRGDKNQSE